MAKTIGKNMNVTDSATMSNSIALNTSTDVKIADVNADRIFFCVNNNGNNNGCWIKLQAQGVDSDHKGIYIGPKGNFIMPADNIYTGEICAIADVGSPDVYVTEY